MLERILNGTKHLSGLAVWIALIGSVILYLAAAVSLFLVVRDLIFGFGDLKLLTKTGAVGVLKTIDFVLIAVGLQIIASGIHQLFVNPERKPVGAMRIESFSELKATVVKVTSIVLVIDFLEVALDIGPSLDVLYYGIAIAVVIVAVAWAIRLEEKSKAEKS